MMSEKVFILLRILLDISIHVSMNDCILLISFLI